MPSLSDYQVHFDPLQERVQQLTHDVSELGREVSSIGRTTQSVVQQSNNLITMLTNSMNGMQNQLGTLVQAMQNFNSTTASGRRNIETTSVDIDKMFEVYRKMGFEVSNLELNLKTLNFTQSEYNKVIKLGNEYNNDRINSYAALSRKYSALKILWDNMTDKEKESTEAGRAMAAVLREIYQEMNLMQQSTGKYQLQVGDYSKAMTGLNIATQQVIREMPVLAQSAQMFVMAISNNIPILLDNIKAVKSASEAAKAHKNELIALAEKARIAGDEVEYHAKMEEANAVKVQSAMKGLTKSIFSWQTLIVLLLSVLPRIIKNIQEKKKALDEQNGSMIEAISLEKMWADAMKAGNSAVVDSITELNVYNGIATDTNRTWEDRIKVAETMRQKWEDELGSLSAEEIALGKAQTAVDNLTESLIRQAEARAYLEEITRLTKEKYDLEQKQQELAQKRIEEEEKLQQLQLSRQQTASMQQWTSSAPTQFNTFGGASLLGADVMIGSQEKAIEKVDEEIKNTDESIQNIGETIQKLKDRITADGLVELFTGKGGGKKAKETLANLGDYYFDWLESIYNLNRDERQREYQLLDLQYQRQIKAAEDRLAKERETGQLSKEQEEYQMKIIENLRESHGRALFDLMLEQDREISEERYNNTIQSLKDEKIILDNQTKEKYQNKVLEKRELIQNEIDYWTEYLKILKAYGKLTVEEYDKIMSNINKLTQEKEDEVPDTLLGWLGFATDTDFTKKQEKNLKKMYSTAIQYMKEWMDARMEMAKVAVEAAEKETEAARKVLEYEMEARANGYASSVDLARKEYEEKMELQRKALAEQQKMQKLQDQINTATQISSLVTATAELWASMASTGPLAVALAVAATAAMWTSFIAAKAQAASLAKKKTYGEGTVELLEGGSHASGHDIDMGTDKNGNQRRAEGGEFFAIINKRNSAKYRKVIPDVIRSFNDGSFAEKYQRANAVMASYAVGMMGGTDVSSLERDVAAIRKQGDTTRYLDGHGNMIIRYKNVTRKILS